ncbi:DNA-processing protein DprA [Alkalibacterium iburiense]|uniref:DNA-processing protein DprA n=1 Tax=Alkalibacterium iburiense TaxID=290589 RepID=A0ABN0XTF2_9LACT
MTALTEDDILILLAHYSGLTRKEKWAIVHEWMPQLVDGPYKDKNKVKLTYQKKHAFLTYLKTRSLTSLKETYAKQSINMVTLASDYYPYLLKHIYDPPFVLFFKGDLSLLDFPLMGVVGARECTQYGKQALDRVLPELVEHNVGIVSGLAKGIDAYAHKETIRLQGKTIGIIGTGLDVTYPRDTVALQAHLSLHHLVLSEYPLGTPPRKHHFPMRNRIISGLSDGVLVIEARARSGSLITARMALEEGRDVFAVPGSIFSELSKGCNDLIKLGAIPVTEASDILNEWKSDKNVKHFSMK